MSCNPAGVGLVQKGHSGFSLHSQRDRFRFTIVEISLKDLDQIPLLRRLDLNPSCLSSPFNF